MALIEQHGPVATAVSSHTFLLQSEWDLVVDVRFTNGLISRAPHSGAVVHTGIADGNVMVSIERHDQAPPVEAGDWEAVAEVTVEAADEELRLAALDAEAPDLPPVVPGPGVYRVRAHARGRDEAYDLSTFDVVEHYLLQIWSAPPAPQVVYKHADHCSNNFTFDDEDGI